MSGLRAPLVALLLSACSSDAPGFAAYAGEAYPNRRPRLESAGHTLGYLANKGSDSISVVDLDAMRLIGNAPVGRDPVDIDGPRHVVVDGAAGLAYVAYSYPYSNQSPHATSLGNNGRLGYVAAFSLPDFTPRGELRLDVSPAELALSGDGKLLAVSHFDTLKALDTTSIEARRANVALIEPAASVASPGATAKRVSTCAVPAAMAYGADSSRLFVACMGEDSLVVIDTENAAVLSRVPAGDRTVNQPYALSRAADGSSVLVSNQVSGSVVQFSTADEPAQLASAHFDNVPFFASFVSANEFVVALQNPDAVSRVSLRDGSVLASMTYPESSCSHPTEPRVLADGSLYLVCQGDGYAPGALLELDPTTLEMLARVEVGVSPERLEVSLP